MAKGDVALQRIKSPYLGFWLFLLIFSTTIWTSLTAQIRVMPLGDGVVQGIGSSPNDVGGFRDDLFLFLNATGMPFDFVGSLNDGFSNDPHHEGHAEATVAEINQDLLTYLQQYRPHMVLIHLGTDDLRQNADVNSVLSELSTTIDLISSYSSETEIYLASLIPSLDFSANQNIDMLNLQLAALYESKQSQGMNIAFVDVNTIFKQTNPNWPTESMSSDFYPNDFGYGIMAQSFLNRINAFSKYKNRDTFTDDFNNRFLLGPNWNTHPKFKIKNGELENTSADPVWDNQLALVNSIVNPNRISFRFGPNASQPGIAETGAAILMNSALIDADGFVVTINNDLLRLWTLVDGRIGDNVVDVNANTVPQPNDVFFMAWGFKGQQLEIDVSINDTPLGHINYSTSPPGANEVKFAGVMLRGALSNNIDDFYLSNAVDATPPAQVSNLSLMHIGATVAQFGWTATGDDSLTGLAAGYDLRFSTFPIDDNNFENASQAVIDIQPSAPGESERAFMSGLDQNTTYYVAIKVMDDEDNASGISNVVVVNTLQTVYFLDDLRRNEIGDLWEASNDVEVGNGAMRTVSTLEDWSSSAVLKTPVSPHEVGFQWVEAAQGEIDKIGVLLKLSAASLLADGYMIKSESGSSQFQLWSVLQGIPGQMLNSFSHELSNLGSGSILGVFMYSDLSGHHFAVFVDDIFYGILSDSAKILGNDATQYCGVIFRGSANVAMDNFYSYSPQAVPSNFAYVSGDGQEGAIRQVLEQPLVVQITDAMGSPVYFGNVDFEKISGDAGLLPPAHPDGTIFIEAERGILEAPMVRKRKDNASGGRFIYVPAGSDDGGKATYKFYVPENGEYVIWGRAIARSGSEDSFIIVVDDNKEITWDVFQSQYQSSWSWDQVSSRGQGRTANPEADPYEVYLSQGIHTLQVKQMDEQGKLDKMIITKDPFFLPSGTGGDGSYASDVSGLSRAYVEFGRQAGEVVVRASTPALPDSILFTVRSNPEPAFRIVEFSGNNQNGKAGFPLANPFAVLIADQYDNPVPDYPVVFEVVDGNGHFEESQPVFTGSDGIASSVMVLTADGPDNRALVHADGLQGSPVEFVGTATSGIPAKIQYVSGSGQDGAAGSMLPFPFEAKVLDAVDDPIEAYPVIFEITSNLGGTLSVDTVYTDASGIARTNLTIGGQLGEYVAHARADGLENSPIVFSASAVAGPAFGMTKVSGDSAAGLVLFPLITPFVVQVSDAFGNPVQGEIVSFKVTEGGGTFVGGASELTDTTNSFGQANANLVLGGDFGNFTNRVEAQKEGLQGSPVEFVASALAPTAYMVKPVDGNSQIGLVNEPLEAPFRVKVANPIDEPIKNHPVTFHVRSGGGVFLETIDTVQTVPTDEQGIASATLRIGPGVGQDVNSVHVTSSSGLTPLVGSPVVFFASGNNDAAKVSIIRGNNQIGVRNSQLVEPFEVQVLNHEDLPVADHPVEFSVISGGGFLDSGNDTVVVRHTNVVGKASVFLTLGNQIGLNSNIVQVTSSDGFSPLAGSPTLLQATATASAASQIMSLTDTHLSGVVGKPLLESTRVKVTGPNNLPVVEHEVEFRIISGNGRIVGSPVDSLLVIQTDSSGIAEIQWVLDQKAGVQRNLLQVSTNNGIEELANSPITFLADGLPDLTDPDSSDISVTTPVSADGQMKSIITVALRDKFMNPIPGREVRIFSSGELNFLEQPTTLTDSLGKVIGAMSSIRAEQKNITAKNVTDNIVLNKTGIAEFVALDASRINLAAGTGQQGSVGTVLSSPLVVSITDAFDNPLPNHPVYFIPETEGGFMIESQPVYSDSLGQAISYYVLSDSPGVNLVEATSTGLDGNPVVYTAIGEKNPPDRITYISGNNQIGTVADTLVSPLVVKVTDANNYPMKGVAVAFSFKAGQGEFVDQLSVLTDIYGMASTKAILGTNPMSHIISASSPMLPGQSIVFLAESKPASVSQISIHSGNQQSVKIQDQSGPLVVMARDPYNNPVAGAGILFEIIEGEAAVVTNQPSASDFSGLSSSAILARTTAGIIKVAASLIDNPDVKVIFSVEILPGAPVNFVLLGGDQQIATAGHYLSEPLRVQVTDAYSNPVPNEDVAFVVSKGAASVIGDSIRFTGSTGIAQCDLMIGDFTGEIEVIAIAVSIPAGVHIFHITAVQNNMPVLVSNIPDQEVLESEVISFDLSLQEPDNDPLHLDVSGLPDGASIVEKNPTEWNFSWTPSYQQSGTYDVAFRFNDGKGGVVRDTVRIHVINMNRPPVISYHYPMGDTSIVRGQQLEFRLGAIDLDGDSLRLFWHENGVHRQGYYRRLRNRFNRYAVI
jgi:hypothetical protein